MLKYKTINSGGTAEEVEKTKGQKKRKEEKQKKERINIKREKRNKSLGNGLAGVGAGRCISLADNLFILYVYFCA